MDQLTEKEVLILDQVLRRSKSSQRDLSKKTGISLGLINVILKKLLKTGMIKVSQLNKRKMEYLLTPEGFMEASRKVYRKTAETIRNYRSIESSISELLKKLHASGYDYFSIHGDGELKELLETTFYRCLEEVPVTLGSDHRTDPRAVILNITPDQLPPHIKGTVIQVLDRIEEHV